MGHAERAGITRGLGLKVYHAAPVSYMGTKRRLADLVCDVALRCPPGPLLDAFSGMCVVASAIGPSRQIWTNDLQYFAQEVSLAHFCSKTLPPKRLDAVVWTSREYSAHVNAHLAIASQRVAMEESALLNEDWNRLNKIYASWKYGECLPHRGIADDATLFRDIFSGSYFGLSQCIEFDAIRFSIDLALRKSIVDTDQHRWLLLALCVALSKCSTSTGHFAQPLTPKAANIKRFAIQRSKSVRDIWLAAIEGLNPVGDVAWRKCNRAFRGDAVHKLKSLSTAKSKPSVVYADPPYTNDQYSRYYHVYDTLIRYDYPKALGRGLYRSDRAISTFSLATAVRPSIEALILNCSTVGSELILSYPAKGLLKDSRDVITSTIVQAFGRKPEVWEIEHEHSTMGGSKGTGKQAVTELIYRAFH